MSREHRAHLGKLLRISSEDRLSGQTNSNFSVGLNNSPFVQQVQATVLKSVSFKNVFPNIFSGNSIWSYEYGGTPSSILLPTAWYNFNDFIISTNALLAADPVITGSVVLSAVVDPPGSSAAENTKILFTSDLPLRLFGKEVGNIMGDVLGLPSLYDETGLVTIAPYLPDLGGIPVVYLCSNVVAGVNTSASSNDGESISVITEIPINVAFGQQVYYQANDSTLETITYQNKRQMTSVEIQLCTRSGAVLDLQQNSLTCLFRLIPVRTHSVG